MKGVNNYIHAPSDPPVIPRETVDLAHAIMNASQRGDPHPLTGMGITRDQRDDARHLIQLYQTQDRFTPERVKELARMPKASHGVTDLAALSDEELQQRTARLLGQPN